jgi:hypothetical protein
METKLCEKEQFKFQGQIGESEVIVV